MNFIKLSFCTLVFCIISCWNNTAIAANCSKATNPGQFCKLSARYNCRAGCYCVGGTKQETKTHNVDRACSERWTNTDVWHDLNAALVYLCPEGFPDSAASSSSISDCYFTFDDKKVYYGQVTCPAGQYLLVDVCTACPTGYTCPGGTWYPIPGSQGLSVAKYTCSAGYYLPANNTACNSCPENNYCVGGEYEFNSSADQGMSPCPVNAPFSPANMWSSTQCGRKLHIGEEVLYLHTTKNTTPSLKIVQGDNVYYANASSSPITVNKNSVKYLKLGSAGSIYYIYDDTHLY